MVSFCHEQCLDVVFRAGTVCGTVGVFLFVNYVFFVILNCFRGLRHALALVLGMIFHMIESQGFTLL